MCVVNFFRESFMDGIRGNVIRFLKVICIYCVKKMENVGLVLGICLIKRKDVRNWVWMFIIWLLDFLVICIGRKICFCGVR